MFSHLSSSFPTARNASEINAYDMRIFVVPESLLVISDRDFFKKRQPLSFQTCGAVYSWMPSVTMNLSLQFLKRSRLIHLCFAIIFFTSGLIVNFVQCVLYLGLRPFNRRLYRKINWYLCATLYSQLVFIGDWWSGSRVILYIDKDDFKKYWGKEHACCVMNHTYEIDWLIGWMLCDRLELLGNCKAYAKKSIQYLPILGWTWKFSEFVFLERSFEKDKDIINKQISELADHPDPIWLLLFPEGTRYTPEKHKISQDFAREKNLKELNYHLQPRTKGFIASLPPMQGKVPAIYDIELVFKKDDPVKPTIRNMLFGKPVVAHMYMKRINMESVPSGEDAQDLFLREMFQDKDKLHESFVKTGDFFATSGVKRLEPFELSKRAYSLMNMCVWSIVTLCPMIYYLIKLLFSGELLYFSMGAGIISIFYILLNRTIGESEISKGSSYGTSTPKKDRSL